MIYFVFIVWICNNPYFKSNFTPNGFVMKNSKRWSPWSDAALVRRRLIWVYSGWCYYISVEVGCSSRGTAADLVLPRLLLPRVIFFIFIYLFFFWLKLAIWICNVLCFTINFASNSFVVKKSKRWSLWSDAASVTRRLIWAYNGCSYHVSGLLIVELIVWICYIPYFKK